MTADGHGVEPARGYSWPAADPGNTLAVKHGALSPRLVAEDAATMLAELRASDAPWLADVDGQLLEGYLHAVAACRRLRAYLAEKGELDGRGRPRHATRLLLAYERRLDRAAHNLGFDPLARAQLGRDTAVARHLARDGLAKVAEAGRQARLAAIERGDAPPDSLSYGYDTDDPGRAGS